MSRMQNILDKAARDGAVLRTGPIPLMPELAPPVTSVLPTPPPADLFVIEPSATSAHASEPVRKTPVLRLHRSLVAALAPDEAAARQYSSLCTRIARVDQAAPVNVILVTSAGQGEGKSTTAANLALTMSREYRRPICIVDTNLRTPTLHRLFGLPDGPGLSDVLAGRIPLDQALTTIENIGITVLPAGAVREHPAELLGSSNMRRVLETLRSRFDRIIVDTPAALSQVDVGLLTPLGDRIVLVVRAGVTSKSAIHDAIATLGSTRVLGVVLNAAA